jgi:hypothetical protein
VLGKALEVLGRDLQRLLDDPPIDDLAATGRRETARVVEQVAARARRRQQVRVRAPVALDRQRVVSHRLAVAA